MKKIIVYTVSIVIALIVVTAGALLFMSMPEEKVKVNIGYKKQSNYLPLFVAMEKGYFAEKNLEVNPVIFDSTNQMMSAVVSGDVDAALGGANLETVFSIEQKSPNTLKIFETLEVSEKTGITCVIVGKNANINRLEDVKGKKTATLPGTFAPVWINAALKTVGLTKEDINLQAIDNKLQLSALESGQVDVLFAVEPICSFGVNKGVGKIIYNEPMQHLGKSLTSSIISVKLLKEEPKTAEKIIEASDKAIDFIRSNPDESLAIMAKYAGYTPESIKGMKIPIYSKSSEISKQNLQDLVDKLYTEGNLEKTFDVSAIIIG